MKIGSLFDGSGGFPMAGAMCGFTPVWASEIEPYPIAVTKTRFPNMKHLGDISKINGAAIDPVDIITFGSPCQDLSVAGKRAGLKHEENGDDETTRSGLFMEAVRIIKEMRNATNGKYPTFALWENVPGAFSSNKGEDFRLVLEELIKIAEPNAVMLEVPKSGWAYADSFSGDGWSLAYRVLDAQYWGVPQRRRRIYLVADFRGQCARKILFERKGLRGDFTESGTQRQGTSTDVEGSVGADDREGTCLALNWQAAAGAGICVEEELVNPLACTRVPAVAVPYTLKIRCGCESGGKAVSLEPGIAAREGGHIYEGVSGTIRANAGDNQMSVAYSVENHPADSRVNLDESGKVQTLTSRMGTGGGNVPMVLALDRASFNQGKNAQYDFEISDKGVNSPLVAKGPGAVCYKKPPHYIVRRLTPMECARLQGFPDRWGDVEPKTEFTDEEYRFWLDERNTHAEINGKKIKDYTKKQMLTWYNKLHSDSAEYKMYGNGVALPCVLYVMQGIAEARNEAMKKDGENDVSDR